MTNTQSDLIRLLSCAVLGEPLPEGFAPAEEDELFRLARLHDLAHLISFALRQHGLLDPASAAGKEFDRQQMLAVWRVGVLEHDMKDIRTAFEREGVDFIPLKGTVVRMLYPEPWMRTSGDIDVLIKPDARQRAVDALTPLGWTSGAKGGNYSHIVSPSGFHIDLHTALLKDGGAACPPLESPWDGAVPVCSGAHEYRLSDEMFYLFHMYHAAHHMRCGSCGVRAVLDTWLLNHRTDFDASARRALLERAKLTRFANVMEAVSEAWFSGAPLEPQCLKAEELLFLYGVYSGAHNLAAAQASAGGKGAYILRRALPPYSSLRAGYPVLDHLPWLLPFCWLHRLGKAALGGKVPAVKKELHAAAETSAMSRELAEIFEEIGLED